MEKAKARPMKLSPWTLTTLLVSSSAFRSLRSAYEGNLPNLSRDASPTSSAVKVAQSTQIDQEKWDLELFSPAKINLFLRITGKRNDGYHDLASLFQTVAFGDKLKFSKLGTEDDRDYLISDSTEIPPGKKNLIVKALILFREKTGMKQHFKVFLEKKIPSRAGMGGGSSDAATALFAANALTGYPASPDDLIEWSAELGSDITFFFSRGTCYCTGRGEILHPQPNMEYCNNVWLMKPQEGLSTPLVFKHLDYSKLSTEDPIAILNTFEKGLADARFINDLEIPAFKVLPVLREMKEDIAQAGFQKVLMSGSGTTIFAIGTPRDRNWPLDFVRKYQCDIWRTEFIQRSGDDRLWYKQEQIYEAT